MNTGTTHVVFVLRQHLPNFPITSAKAGNLFSHNNPGGPTGVVFQAHFAITVREAATGEFIWQNVPGKDSQLDKPEDA